jgi:cysteine desulfurase family protein (TIGR01976 family)
MPFDVAAARAQFPALDRRVGDRPAVYLDGPGGTQVPRPVIAAMSGVLEAGAANVGGRFAASRYSEETVAAARAACADLFGASGPEEIAFGQNMTSITLAVSRAIGRTWRPGDEVVVSRLDHDANVWPWVMAAAERGAVVRYADFDPEAGCELRRDHVEAVLSERTRLVALTHASNAVGTVVDVAGIVAAAHGAGALAYVDAVHHTPHGLVDVAATGCDFLVASAYKFFGPHTGVFYGRHELLVELDAVRIRPAPAAPPGKWETGTQSFESLAGVTAAVDYLASLGRGSTRRERLASAWERVGAHEAGLAQRFLDGVGAIEGVRLYGRPGVQGRVPTFAVAVGGIGPSDAAAAMGDQGVFVWSGDYYAVEVMQRLGVSDSGGLLRIGFVHYSTPAEVDVALAALERLAAGRSLGDLPVP